MVSKHHDATRHSYIFTLDYLLVLSCWRLPLSIYTPPTPQDLPYNGEKTAISESRVLSLLSRDLLRLPADAAAPLFDGVRPVSSSSGAANSVQVPSRSGETDGSSRPCGRSREAHGVRLRLKRRTREQHGDDGAHWPSPVGWHTGRSEDDQTFVSQPAYRPIPKSLLNALPMTIFRTSVVPAPISYNFASLIILPAGISFMYPIPPKH